MMNFAKTQVLAIALLALALTFGNAWPGFGVLPQFRVSIEVMALVGLGIVLLVRAPQRRAARVRLALLAALLSAMVLLHYVDVTVPALFGRPVNLFWDGRHLPQLLRMATVNSPWWLITAATLTMLVALLTLYAACHWALGRVCLAAVASGHGCRIAAGLILGAGLGGTLAAYGPATLRERIVTPLAVTYGKQMLFVAAVFTPGATDRLLSPSPVFGGEVKALGGVDVLIVFSESYGAATFEDPQLSSALQPARMALQQAITTTDRHSASALFVSPTFGGGSWLAHAAVLSGVDMREADHYALLLASKRQNLVRHFKANGYRSVALMPGLRADWPEGAFYGFDQIYDARTLDYAGPSFGFWRIPDQFSMARLHRLELTQPELTLSGLVRMPRFIVFPTITSHLPFEPLPPLLPDWQFARDADLSAAFEKGLDATAVRASLASQPNWLRLREPYARSIDYALRWQASYLKSMAPRAALTIIIGDHQPAATVVGRDADRAVPIHVISDSAELIQKFRAAGFAAGIVPQRPAMGQMHELTALLIRLLDGCGAPVSASHASAGDARLPACEPARVDVPGARPGG